MKTTCARCGTEFNVKPRRFKTTGNYCTRACWYAAQAPRPARRTGTEKPCVVCGKPFYTQVARSTARFCSRACKGVASQLPMKTCVVCGNAWKPRFGQSAQPCCSRACGDQYRKHGESKPCETCGTAFYAAKGRSQSARFCSHACANVWQSRNTTMHTCKMCGKTFRWSPSRHKATKITYCSLSCRNADPDRRTMLISMNAIQQQLRPNRVERAGYAMLDSLGMVYERQHVIGGTFCVDAFVPSLGMVIQFDGDYWHGNPATFPEPDARQRKRMAVDRSQDAYLAACGYTVVRFWASDMTNHPDRVITELQRVLTRTAPTPAAQP